jgi:hypothetical protein
MDHLRVGDELVSGLGQSDVATLAAKQLDAGLSLECCELLGDRGRGEVQRLGGRYHGPTSRELAQRLQTANVKHRTKSGSRTLSRRE